ncbi:MAG: DNA translocase FtsK, partial [Planctomycetes bacterium]|nr:DNA translocase FtsK [Planctomycetota bacterium]
EVDGALALVSFGPAERTLLFTSAQVEPVRARLVALNGRMAGVLPPAAASSASPPASSPSPAAARSLPAPAPSPSPAAAGGTAALGSSPSPAAAGEGRGAGRSEPPTPPAPASSPPYDDLARRLLRVFDEYKAPVRLAGPPIVGPTYLRFPVDPQKGVRSAQVQRVAPELGVRLKLAAPPFVHVSRGGLVVDVERPDRRLVPFADVRPQLPPPDPLLGSARVPLGVDLDGTLQSAELDRTEHCHILVAGTTGSGKSEWLRSALAGLLLGNTPETLRLVLIDPKRNAFADLKGSPYLLHPSALVYPDEQDVTEVLDGLIEEMERRYRELEAERADTLAELIRRRGRPAARIVCFCDEYADLIAHGRDERRAVEARIQRLGAKARASGIHLIIATQQPSRDVLKGALDANLPARVGLRMAKDVESRMLLGEPGAERLLGRGDLLFKEIGDPRRLQAPFLSAAERAEIFAAGR